MENIVILLFGGACVGLLVYFAIPWFYGRVSRVLLARKAQKHGVLALTFDDGPGSRLTIPILDILAQYDAKATFFVQGRRVPGREHILRDAAKRGHEIGLHGYNHLNHWKVSPIRAIKDITLCRQAIDGVLGLKSGKYVFRPPFGKLNFFSLLYLLLLQMPILYWTRDIGDTWRFDAWLAENKDNRGHSLPPVAHIETKGDVILAHDFDRTDTAVDQFVLESVKSTLAAAKRNHLRFLTVSELLALGA